MTPNTLDISVRVSRMGGRDEASEAEQEARCRAIIEAQGMTVGVVEVEVNVSGGKAAKSRGIGRIVKRVQAGESRGVVVYDLSRMTREEPWTAIKLMADIASVPGCMVLGAIGGFDSRMPGAVAMAGLQAQSNNDYLELCRSRSNAGRARAMDRGAYAGKTPPGYGRTETKALVIDEAEAKIVRDIFGMKLDGKSLGELAAFARANGFPTMTVGGIRTMLANPVYIGTSKVGTSPAIIDTETFAKVQSTPKGKRNAKGAGARFLAQGIAKCANCGSTLIVTKSGKSFQFYCRGQRAEGCDKRGAVMCETLDAFVLGEVNRAFGNGGVFADAYGSREAITEAQALLAEKTTELDAIKGSTKLISSLGIEAFETMVADAAAGVEIAEALYTEAKANADAMTGMAELLDRLNDEATPMKDRRAILAAGIESVLVGSGRVQVADKARVVYVGGVIARNPDNTRAGLVTV